MRFPTQKEVEELRQLFPAGTRVRCDDMHNDPRPIPRGTTGTVVGVDDAGQIVMRWDNGRGLSLIPGVDAFHITG